MKISENGIELIKNFEGYKEKAYKCPAGVWTIGYGHTQGVREGDSCTQAQAKDFLLSDLKTIERVINANVKQKITQNQFDALCSFTYNVGISAFAHSTLLKFLNQRNYFLAADQFDRWVFINGKVSNGLKNRRTKEKELFLK